MPDSLLRLNVRVNLQHNEKVHFVARRHIVVLLSGELLLFLLWSLSTFVFLSRLSTAGFDGLNSFLFVLGLLFFIGMLYVYFDWRNDMLLVTNLRVIYQDATVLGRISRNELYNRDIQDVATVTGSIIARRFNYGQINVQTASRLRNIEFRGVSNPEAVRDQILKYVDPLKKDYEVDRVRQLVRAKVLGIGEPPKPPPPVDLIPEGKFGNGFLWVIPPSPRRRGDSVIWHKHWVFLIVALADPFLMLLIVVTAWSLFRSQGLLNGASGIGVLVVTVGVALLWMIYAVADWRDDEYIITPQNVIDIERTPFGRESQRETSWDRIEKVSLIQPNFISRVFRYGYIELATAGQQENFTFRRVGNPNQVMEIIADYRDHFRRVNSTREFDSTLMLMHYYHDMIKESVQPLPPPEEPTQRLP